MITDVHTETRTSNGELWVRRGCTLVVAGVAAYSSYAHQRQFALDGGADPVAALLWPLSVDGLVVLASTGLLKERRGAGRRARWAVRLAFLLGVAASLAANVAAAPTLSWQPVLVAGWPPLALLLAVELLLHARRRDNHDQAESETHAESIRRDHVGSETETGRPATLDVARLTSVNGVERRNGRSTAEEVMWAYCERERQLGRTPTGAELDRVAGTNNYGRAVLARWRRAGRLPNPPASPPAVEVASDEVAALANHAVNGHTVHVDNRTGKKDCRR